MLLLAVAAAAAIPLRSYSSFTAISAGAPTRFLLFCSRTYIRTAIFCPVSIPPASEANVIHAFTLVFNPILSYLVYLLFASCLGYISVRGSRLHLTLLPGWASSVFKLLISSG